MHGYLEIYLYVMKIEERYATLPGVETTVDDSDVAIRQQGIVGCDTTAGRGEDGWIALDFVPQTQIL